MRLLRILFEQDRGGNPGRCGQVFRIALSPHVFEKEREGAVRSVAFSPDGERIVFGGHDRKVAVMKATSGEILFEKQRGSMAGLDEAREATKANDGREQARRMPATSI